MAANKYVGIGLEDDQLPPPTLRMSKKHYVAVLPKTDRDPRHLYTDADVTRLHFLHELVGSRHSIGGSRGCSHPIFDGWQRRSHAAGPPAGATASLRGRVMTHRAAAPSRRADALARRSSAEPSNFLESSSPLSSFGVGDRWERGSASNAHGHRRLLRDACVLYYFADACSR